MEVYKLANGLRYGNIEIVYRIFSDKKLLTLFINDFFDFIGRDIHVSLNDVLKFEVDYSFLHKNNKILKKFPHTSEFPTYEPHMTIAMVRKGKGDKYTQTLPTNLQKILKPSHFVYSKANGKEVKIDIKKYKVLVQVISIMNLPRQRCQKCLLVFLNDITRNIIPSNGAKPLVVYYGYRFHPQAHG